MTTAQTTGSNTDRMEQTIEQRDPPRAGSMLDFITLIAVAATEAADEAIPGPRGGYVPQFVSKTFIFRDEAFTVTNSRSNKTALNKTRLKGQLAPDEGFSTTVIQRVGWPDEAIVYCQHAALDRELVWGIEEIVMSLGLTFQQTGDAFVVSRDGPDVVPKPLTRAERRRISNAATKAKKEEARRA